MTAAEYGLRGTDSVPCPTEAELRHLDHLGRRFPRHRIFWYRDSERGFRFTAQGAVIDARPHTIITQDLAELQSELEQATPYTKGLRRPSRSQ
jgi:hypothetical protein